MSRRMAARAACQGNPAYRISGASTLSNCLAQEMCEMNLNTPAPPLSGTMDVDEFMGFLETRPDKERWDLIEGIAVMMASPNHAHQRISSNLSYLLNTPFSPRQLATFHSIAPALPP